jgi:hypothetical protein
MKQILIILGLIVGEALTANPGAKLQANQAAMTYAKGIGVQIMNNKLPGLHLPDISGSESILSYSLTSVLLSSFNAPASGASATLLPPRNVRLSLSGMTARVTANYHIKVGSGWFSVSKSGSIDASASSTSLTESVGVVQSGGKPQLSPGSCSANIASLDITFHGDLVDSIINLFKSEISSYVKGQLNSVLCNEVSDLIKSQANSLLSGIPTSVEIADGFNIDYSLTNNPTVSGNAVTIDMLGEVWYKGHHTDSGIPQAGPMGEVINTGGKMFCAELEAESVIGSSGYAAQVSGIMHLNVDASVLSSAHLPTSYLNCSCPKTGQCMGGFIPQIQSKCTAGTVSVMLTSTIAPTAHVNASGAFLNFEGTMDFKGNTPGQSPVELFTVSVTLGAVIPSSLSFEGWKIKGQVHVTGAGLTVKSSNIGSIDQAGLEQLWQIALLGVVEGELNSITQAGIGLPSIPYFTVLNPVLAFGERTLQVCFDGQYTGPTLY